MHTHLAEGRPEGRHQHPHHRLERPIAASEGLKWKKNGISLGHVPGKCYLCNVKTSKQWHHGYLYRSYNLRHRVLCLQLYCRKARPEEGLQELDHEGLAEFLGG